MALSVGVPLAVLGGARTFTWAAAQLTSWQDGQVLTAKSLNDNLAALAAEQAPAKILESFNTATNGTANDLRWAMQHAAAGAACAAASPVTDSPAAHIVLVHPAGVTCTAACAANTAGMFTACRTSIAIGSVMMTQATKYTDQVALNYNYGCNDSQNAYDETKGQGLKDSYAAYCCCYRAP